MISVNNKANCYDSMKERSHVKRHQYQDEGLGQDLKCTHLENVTQNQKGRLQYKFKPLKLSRSNSSRTVTLVRLADWLISIGRQGAFQGLRQKTSFR